MTATALRPIEPHMSIRRLWSTLSKAFDTSRKSAGTDFPVSGETCLSSRIDKSCQMVEPREEAKLIVGNGGFVEAEVK